MERAIGGMRATLLGGAVALALAFGATQAAAGPSPAATGAARACNLSTCNQACRASCPPGQICRGMCDPVDGCVCYNP